MLFVHARNKITGEITEVPEGWLIAFDHFEEVDEHTAEAERAAYRAEVPTIH